jgi:CBS domain containing-hemolysin-like protein
VYLSSLTGEDRDYLDGDPIPLFVDLVLIFSLVLLNGFFVAAEFAMVKVRGSRIDTLVQEGHKRAKVASHLMDHLDAYLSACRLGITLASLGLGWIGAPAIARMLEPLFTLMNMSDKLGYPLSFVIGFLFISVLHIVLGELAPKSVAISKADIVTMLAATPLIFFRKMLSPFSWFVNGIAGVLLKPFGIDTSEASSSAHTEEEIRILVKESHKNGLIDKTELTLMDNIFEFAETNAREIMIPRTDMSCLYGNLSFEANKSIALREMHTRYPVCDKDKDNIIGFVHIKDLLKVSDSSILDIREVMRPMTTVPESMPISALLKLLQKRKSQIAILIDEYGGTSGMVTLEDIMEEIVGEIQDEFDEERPDVEKRDDTTYSINGMMLIEEVNNFFGLDISTDDYDTIGGWIYSQIENPPMKSQYVQSEQGFRFTIEETDHMRISRITVTRTNETGWEHQAETG